MLVGAAAFLPIILAEKKTDGKIVTINQFADHPALNDASNGVKDALRKRIPSVILDEQNAQGNPTQAFQIAKHQAASNPDAMVGIATPSAQSALKARKGDKVIVSFAAVTDPKAANLDNGVNLVGVTDRPPVEKLISLVVKIFPNKKRIGAIFNPGEINSINTVARLQKICDELGLTLVEAPVNSSSNIKMATQKLVEEVDIIYVPQDNMVVSSIDAVIQVTQNRDVPIVDNIPAISNDDSYIAKGIFMALGTNYYKSGLQLGNMLADQIESKSTKNNIQDADSEEMVINYELAETKYGLTKDQIEDLLK
jgi:putative ABC transport system substrate-binding protein